MKDLEKNDYTYLNLLNSKLNKEDFETQFDLYNNNDNYFIKVEKKMIK